MEWRQLAYKYIYEKIWKFSAENLPSFSYSPLQMHFKYRCALLRTIIQYCWFVVWFFLNLCSNIYQQVWVQLQKHSESTSMSPTTKNHSELPSTPLLEQSVSKGKCSKAVAEWCQSVTPEFWGTPHLFEKLFEKSTFLFLSNPSYYWPKLLATTCYSIAQLLNTDCRQTLDVISAPLLGQVGGKEGKSLNVHLL